jgi:DNA-binding transcriptional ArsR family regulator
MKPIDRFLDRLEGVETNAAGFKACCPVSGHGKGCGDLNPSLHVTEGSDGRVLLKCRAGCATEDVVAALGLGMRNLFPQPANNGRTKTKRYEVRNLEGDVVAFHHREDHVNGDKDVWWSQLDGTKGLGGKKVAELPLYGAECLPLYDLDADIVVTEGEKACDALRVRFVPAVGTVTGAGGTPSEKPLEALRDRNVVLWPDNDNPGRDHMRRVGDKLLGVAKRVRWFEWKDAPDGGDAADHPGEPDELLVELNKGSATFTHSQTPIGTGVSESSALVVKRFRELPKFTGPRPYVVEGLVPARFPTTIYGDGGSAKSIIALSMAQAIARGADNWCERAIERQRACLFVDFELDEEEQSRRALQIARGDGLDDSPEGVFYLCAAAHSTERILNTALAACTEHGIELVIIDSVGIALTGDPSSASDVVGFFRDLDRFRAAGVAVVLVDHQAKKAVGEGYQNKTAYGSVYKGNLSRSQIQVEAKGRENGTLRVVLRQNKANFAAPANPFAVRIGFTEEMITLGRDILDETELREERALRADDRVLLTLSDGPATAEEIAEKADIALGTVRNVLTKLDRGGLVEPTGETQGKARVFRLTVEGEARVFTLTHSQTSRAPGVSEPGSSRQGAGVISDEEYELFEDIFDTRDTS